MSIDIRYLRSFLTVAQCLSFTEAAKQLYIGQPALSKQIAELEKELGVELFIRHRYRPLELTPSGKTLLREGTILFDKVSEVIEKTRQAKLGIRGNIKIGCFGLEDAFLPYALKKFRSLYPQISIDIRVLSIRMIEDALELGELDLGFIPVLGENFNSNRFMRRLIFKTPLCFLLPNNHPYASLPSIDIAALANESFIVLSETETPTGINWFINYCASRGFTPKISSKTTKMESVYWQVEAGMGISFTAKDPQTLRHIPLHIALVDMQGEDTCSNIVAEWKKNHYNPAISLFLKVLETMEIKPQNNSITDI